jgi:hypothetical protein
MTTATAEMAKKINQNNEPREIPGESLALDRCYRQIGISAVAAAVRYQGGSKNPAYAPVPLNWHDRGEAA